MSAYYNEIDKGAAAWLRELMAAGLIPDGEIDERSIVDVEASDLAGFAQCHFFAGIGGWSRALSLAGWPEDRPVWTGSCPCQPFSEAGQRGGFADERHLWPAWAALIAECRPPVIFGEQVASNGGMQWFDVVHADLEAAGYAVGAADLCAAGVGAPHIRQRLYFGAKRLEHTEGNGRQSWGTKSGWRGSVGGCGPERLANPIEQGWQGRIRGGADEEREALHGHAGRDCTISGLADATSAGRQLGRPSQEGDGGDAPRVEPERLLTSYWANPVWLPCRDGKLRPTQPSLFPLANGVRGRVGLLRGAGNAIVPQVAQAFIEAFGT